jgi:uncharacterized protein YdiU (UPF0061 family)
MEMTGETGSSAGLKTPLLPLSRFGWENRFVERFPGDPERRNFVRPVSGILYSETVPTPVARPTLIGWSERLGRELGIARPGEDDAESLAILAGNRVPRGARPYSARYGGHQFGHWAGQLGDGRAITLGELVASDGRRLEVQLKGAGPTPYSRRADGRAVLRSSLRELLCSEAMHFLGVPTTRALSLVATGETVTRDMFYDGNPKDEPGAITSRLAPSFLRFGNFQILASSGEHALLKDLADFTIAGHYPELDLADPDVYGKFLDEVAVRTARMVAHWMRVGFVHGVMNTDNMSILGLTIDYGPYGWLEPFDPDWTPNTTDAEGRRYRYGGQPQIAHWNLARLCEAFHPLVKEEERLHRSLDAYVSAFSREHARMTADKIGIRAIEGKEDLALVGDLFDLLRAGETDMTIFFRSLSDWSPDGDAGSFAAAVARALYSPASPDALARWGAWKERYVARLRADGRDSGEGAAERARIMRATNPRYVARNWIAQTAIDAAERGDGAPLERLLRVLERPYDDQPGAEDLASRRPEWARERPGCSALSCSS